MTPTTRYPTVQNGAVRRVILKAAYAELRLRDAKGPGNGEAGVVEGIAIAAADAMGLATTPFGFRLVIKEAVDEWGQPPIDRAASRESAARQREAWEDNITATVIRGLR